MDQFQEIGLNVAIDLVRGMMRDDNRIDKNMGNDPRWSEEQIEYIGPVLWLLTQRGAISLVHAPEFRKARAMKDAMKTFLEDPPDDYLDSTMKGEES